jgi:hypothetical protein
VTPQKALYTNGNGSATSGNLSELDSLLEDLSKARYGGGIEKKRKNKPGFFFKLLTKQLFSIF